jgi:molybdate transport system permease protein
MASDLEALTALLADAATRHTLWLTAKVAIAAVALHAGFGLGLGYLLAQPNWRGRNVLDIAVTLPLVFPPMATGFLLLMLLMLLGRRGPLGGPLQQWFGIELVFSFWGLLLAAFVSGLPLVVKPIQAAFENLPKRLAEAARTLGKTELEIFLFVLLPNIRSAVAAGLVLALGRALGEVGITLMLGGNIAGRTVTASLEIYNAVLNGDFERAGLLSAILGGVTVVLFSILRRTAKSPLGW